MNGPRNSTGLIGALLAAAAVWSTPAALAESARMELVPDEKAGRLTLKLDGREAFVYRFGDQVDLPHFTQLNTPSGKNLVVAKKDPYPHHRAFWFADTVERDGVKADLYNAYYSGVKTGAKVHEPPFKTGIRHLSFSGTSTSGPLAAYEEKLVWETNRNTEPFPVLDEHRKVQVRALEEGGYLMDLTFTLTAAYGDVNFVSDAVHYGWPYLRISPEFSGESGGTITSDTGTTGQKETNLKPARWIDYSNTVEGATEGVAVFQWPDGKEHRWLTREYGTFGPRRPDEQSGKPFTLRKGESISQRVGVLVHAGDVRTGRVAEVYEDYVKEDAPGTEKPTTATAGLSYEENLNKKILVVVDGGTPVLTYRYGDELQEGVDAKYTRSCYIHPLYSLDGKALTEDFPADHRHHRGVFWTWPAVEVRGQKTQTWHPAEPPLRQEFVRWTERKSGEDAVFGAENRWVLDGKEEVAREQVTVRVHPVENESRAVDVELQLEAVGGPLTLQGQPGDSKGYGGFCFRAVPELKGVPLTTDAGVAKEDLVNEPRRWADLSSETGGVALFVPEDHPNFPPRWLARNSYAGFLNPYWPGLEPVTLQPGEPVKLRYRLLVHRGDVKAAQVAEAYQRYASEN